MSAPATSDAAFCADLVRSHDFDRYAATLFVDAVSRRALLALYAFNIEIERVRGLVSQPLPGEIRLQYWTDLLAGNAHGGTEGNPVAVELLSAVEAYQLPRETLTRLIEAHLFDLYNDPMPDMDVLSAHLSETEGALFVLAARILGHGGEAIDHLARHAAMAHGLTRLIARFGYDSARRQLYLPKDVLERHGSGEHEAFGGQPQPKLRAALDDLIGQAREQLDGALKMLSDVPREARPAFLPLTLVGRDLDELGKPDRNPFTPFERSRLATLWTLWRAARSKAFR
ncbi:phytoene/squalene synthase family protein [Rhodopseudomonas sp. B29]|uniref:phytoene/squalene synthase family protein n=1 Tax=Rhodopseudomonas sp. B29 TaxID=95607 RepID=UPI00034B519B|nr:phytoene/squalene synthase family protein [Rhodopseudomonas sp. B29]